MKYTKEVLDEALEGLRNEDVKERRVAATVFMKAACAELGTANTKPVKEWFVSNIEDYITEVKDETDSENIWRHLYTTQQFCARYIQGSYLFIINSEIITEENEKNVEEKAKEYVNSLRKIQKNPKVLQGIASFFWVYEESFVWDIFTEVLKKKKDNEEYRMEDNEISWYLLDKYKILEYLVLQALYCGYLKKDNGYIVGDLW